MSTAANKILAKYGYNPDGDKMKRRPNPPKKKPGYKVKTKELRKKEMKKSNALIQMRETSEMSCAEEIIAKFLRENNVRFEREKYGPKLYNPRTRYLLFIDFYLPDHNVAIEYDGWHHYKSVNGKDALMEQKFKDKIKNRFCHRAGILLLRLRGQKDIEVKLCQFFDKLLG